MKICLNFSIFYPFLGLFFIKFAIFRLSFLAVIVLDRCYVSFGSGYYFWSRLRPSVQQESGFDLYRQLSQHQSFLMAYMALRGQWLSEIILWP